MSDAIYAVLTLLFWLGVLAVPASLAGLIGRAVARSRSRRIDQPPEVTAARGKRAFWLTFVIGFALELLVFGACVALLANYG